MTNSKGVRVWFCKAEGYEEVTDDQEYADKAYPLPGECEQGIAFTDSELESLITDARNEAKLEIYEGLKRIFFDGVTYAGRVDIVQFQGALRKAAADYIKSKEKIE